MLGGCGRNEIEAVGRTFGTGAKAPITVSTVGSLGETFAAGPILNTAIGLEIASWDKLPRGICPSGGCSPVDRSKPARFMVNGISYEGMCSSMIIEKTAGKSI
jgi:hypothetical protein